MTIPFSHHGENHDLVVQPFAGVFAGPIPEEVLLTPPVIIPLVSRAEYDDAFRRAGHAEFVEGDPSKAQEIFRQIGLRVQFEGDGK